MKKVLASVLAGAMVLGMSSMAFAAPTLKLGKPDGTDREYDMILYTPAGTNYREDSVKTIQWSDGMKIAFNSYKSEYARYKKALDVGTADAVREYFKKCYSDNRKTVVDYYEEFFQAANGDLTYTDFKTDINAATGLNSKFATIVGGDMADYTLAKLNTNSGALLATPATTPYLDTEVAACATAIADVTPAKIESAIDKFATVNTNNSAINGGLEGEYAEHKSSYDMTDSNPEIHMYTYGEDHVKEVRVNVWVKHGDSIRADVNSGKVSVSKKLFQKNWKDTDADIYMFTVKAKADVRDFELSDFEIEFDVENDYTYFLKGDVAYSDYREVAPDDRLTVTKSDADKDHEDGCVFSFNEPIDETARIKCDDYVDLYFDGNYGTDFENLRVMTDDITEVEDFFQDYDIDYYDFIGRPKFAKDVKCIIDADSDSYIYEYDKTTGDVVDITDEAEYTSDGWEFKRKTFKTYVVLEEPYEGGNVKAEKEPVSEEPEDEPEDTEEPKDDTANEGSKPNPGTGAYPLF